MINYPISYNGNKYKETSELKIKQYDIIAEPFGGIFGFSRYIFFDQKKTTRFLINDCDKDLISLHLYFKNESTENIKKNLENLYENLKNKPDNDIRKYIKNNKYNDINHLFVFYIIQSCYLHTGDRIKQKINNIEKLNTLKIMFERCEFFNMDYKDFINKVKEYEGEKLIYFDPPYFNSSNKTYISSDCEISDNKRIYNDATQMYIDIKNYLDEKIHCILIINYSALIHYVFEKYEKKRYSKIYNHTGKKGIKNKTIHIVYQNF